MESSEFDERAIDPPDVGEEESLNGGSDVDVDPQSGHSSLAVHL